ncbi:MAG: FAD-dependent oxidoreductase [Clostridiales bacterium]|nr:FAD-dependent oxidoreductase [Clostridiales bacterium]
MKLTKRNMKSAGALLMVLCLTACSASTGGTAEATVAESTSAVAAETVEETQDTASAYTAGTYTSNQFGMGGYFDVNVTFSDDAIEKIEVGENHETTMVGTEAIRILSDRIVENQSLNVDTITGATYSSNALIYGVWDCVKQADGDLDALLEAPVEIDDYADDVHETDILIVGGGLAGITAALSAAENGGNVILLEAKDYLGGNAVLSTGTFILAGTSVQEGVGIEDDPETFYNWALENSNYTKDPVQVRLIADHGQELVDWFASLGVNFNTDKVNSTDGSEINRGHALSPNIGTSVQTLANDLEERGIDVRYRTKADGFILNDAGEVIGVTANSDGNKAEYYGKQIVLATGGWGDNNDMIVKYWGDEYDGLVYGGAIGMDGTMILEAMDLGADTVDMESPHIDATLEVSRGITITTNVLRNCGGILLRATTGQRFADEQSSHSEIAAAVMHDLGDEYYYEIFDDTAFTYSEAVTSKIQSYVDMGLTKQYDSISEMAEALGVDETVLTNTLEDYNAAARGEIEDEFGRTSFNGEMEAPYYVMKVSNGVACTTGGLKVDENMQVIDTNGEPMANLYAIGETSGGYRVNYVGGDSLSHSAISGMVLGRTLAEENAAE